MVKYNLRVVYETKVATTLSIQNVSLGEAIKKCEEIDKKNGNEAVGYYIQKVKD